MRAVALMDISAGQEGHRSQVTAGEVMALASMLPNLKSIDCLRRE